MPITPDGRRSFISLAMSKTTNIVRHEFKELILRYGNPSEEKVAVFQQPAIYPSKVDLLVCLELDKPYSAILTWDWSYDNEFLDSALELPVRLIHERALAVCREIEGKIRDEGSAEVKQTLQEIEKQREIDLKRLPFKRMIDRLPRGVVALELPGGGFAFCKAAEVDTVQWPARTGEAQEAVMVDTKAGSTIITSEPLDKVLEKVYCN